MNIIWQGYIFAVISSVFSAIYVVPKKLSKQKPVTYAMIMGCGYLIAASIGYAALKSLNIIDEPLFFPRAYLACINGIVWAVASVAVLSSIDRIGLAKSNQWKSLQGPVGSLLMMVFLSEFLTANVVFLVLAIIVITLAAMMFSTREKSTGGLDKRGILYALIAAVFYGISALLSKMLTLDGLLFSQQIYQAMFIVIATAFYQLVRYRTLKPAVPGTSKMRREIVLPLIGGVLFFGNGSFNVLAYRYLEGSIAFMMHQLNAIWLFLIGVLIFKEIDFKKHRTRLLTGLALSVAGMLLLVLAKV